MLSSLSEDPQMHVADVKTSNQSGDCWNVKNCMKLCEEGQESVFQDKVPLLESVRGVRDAVEQLNRGDVKCPLGYCVVKSQQQGGYFLLFRADDHAVAMSALGLKAVPSVTQDIAPSRATPEEKVTLIAGSRVRPQRGAK